MGGDGQAESTLAEGGCPHPQADCGFSLLVHLNFTAFQHPTINHWPAAAQNKGPKVQGEGFLEVVK
jgi:hypothetical protein